MRDYSKPQFFWLPSEMAYFAMMEREENENENALKRKRASSLTFNSIQKSLKAAKTSLGFQRIKPAMKSWASKSREHIRQRWDRGSGRDWWELREREEDACARAEVEEWLDRRRLVLGREELGTGGEGPSTIGARVKVIKEEKEKAKVKMIKEEKEKEKEKTPKSKEMEAFEKKEQRSVDNELEVEIDPECCEKCRLKFRKKVREGKRKAE